MIICRQFYAQIKNIQIQIIYRNDKYIHIIIYINKIKMMKLCIKNSYFLNNYLYNIIYYYFKF